MTAARTHVFAVVAEDAAGCRSSPGAGISAIVGAQVVVAAQRIDDSGAPLPDGLLEPGETVDLELDLRNAGTLPASNVQATLASATPGLVVVGAGPIAYGTIGAAQTIAAPGAFRVRADPGVPIRCELVVSVDADEGCFRAPATLVVAQPDLARDGESIDDSAGNGDANWDAGETIALILPLRNDATRDALGVDATLSFRGAPVAGVTITQPVASYPDIVVGASAPTDPPAFGLSANAGMGPRTRVPLQLDVRVAGQPHRTLDVDLVVGRFITGTFEWTYERPAGTYVVEVLPVVLQLTDDDADGVISKCDIPDVVVIESRLGDTVHAMVALSGDDGHVIWDLEDPCTQMNVFASLAGGDVDLDGENEIITAGSDGHACAISDDGVVEWRTASPMHAGQSFGYTIAPHVVDLDGDGTVEIVAGHTVINGEDGSVQWDFPRDNSRTDVVLDLDLDGDYEVIAAGNNLAIYEHDGTPHPMDPAFRNVYLLDPAAVGNIDADPYPEFCGAALGALKCWEHDGVLKWQIPTMPNGRGALGPACMMDVDADGFAEIAVQANNELYMVEEDGTIRWSRPVNDVSGAAGISGFDFDGDGPPELMFRDHSSFWVFDGFSGEVLWQTPMSSGTAFEYPIVVDVDNDGYAEIIVLDGFVGGIERVRCIGNAPWPPTRGVWNQEDYSVVEVEHDGSIVSNPVPRYRNANDFRVQPIECPCEGPAPGVSIGVVPECPGYTRCFSASVPNARGPLQLTWDWGDGSPPSTGAAPCHDFPGPGLWPVRLRVVDAFACPGEWSGFIDMPEPLVVDWVPPVACTDQSACFSANIAGGTPPYDLSWDFGDGSPSDATPAPCHVYTVGGPVTAWLAVRDAQGCRALVSHVVDIPRFPPDVGAALRVDQHGDHAAPSITAVLSWTTDAGLPRPLGETWVVRRAESPTPLADSALGLATTSLVDSTPRTPEPATPHCWYYVVLAENRCGVRSAE